MKLKETIFLISCYVSVLTDAGVVFQIKRVTLADGSQMVLLWLSRDPEEILDASRSHGNLTLASSLSSTLDQSGHSLGEVGILIRLSLYIIKRFTYHQLLYE